MKLLLIASLLCLAGCQHGPQSHMASAPPICLRSYDIFRTDIPDDKTILFTMLDHTVYKNTLPFACTGLRSDTRGFTYEPTNPSTDEICSNLVTIRTNTTQNVCELGDFTQISGRRH